MVAAGGLMAAAQIAPIAQDFKIANEPVGLFGFQMAALTFAISLDRIFDGFGRPFFGWVSDTIGREHTMFIAFGTAALMLLTLVDLRPHSDRVRAGDGGVFRRVRRNLQPVPGDRGDTFGAKYATTNNGMLYTAKGTASLLVPLASIVAGELRLAGRVRRRRGAQRHRGAAGNVRDQADAARLHPGHTRRRPRPRDDVKSPDACPGPTRKGALRCASFSGLNNWCTEYQNA